MDDRRAGAAELKRNWPVAVRRARAADKHDVLGFASRTWDGWDYVPHAFDHWLAAADGVLLVATVEPAGDGQPLDHDGAPLETGQVVAVARVALPSPAEAWLEGIRVDPRVRGMDVATELQLAELDVAARHGARVVRYATGERNEASHRLGARHGFRQLCALRTYRWNPTGGEEPRDEDDASGYRPATREAAGAARRALLARLGEHGRLVQPAQADSAWRRLSGDATFNAGERLYELRGWALQELTAELFARHAAAGEVVLVEADGASATAIVTAELLPAEDASLHLALLAGDGLAALALVSEVQSLSPQPLRFRLPDADAPLTAEIGGRLPAAGFRPREWDLHILGRRLDGDA